MSTANLLAAGDQIFFGCMLKFFCSWRHLLRTRSRNLLLLPFTARTALKKYPTHSPAAIVPPSSADVAARRSNRLTNSESDDGLRSHRRSLRLSFQAHSGSRAQPAGFR